MNNNKNKFYVLVVVVLVIIVVITVYAMRVKTWRKIEIEQRKKEKTSNRVQFEEPQEEPVQKEIAQSPPCDIPPTPEIFSDSGREGSEIFISWSPVSNVQKYVVYLKEMTEGAEDVSPVNYDQKIAVKSDTWYYVFAIPEASIMTWTIIVNAVNDCGESDITNDVLRIS
jgi:hypothetical protein